jgi:G3E family GTPase
LDSITRVIDADQVFAQPDYPAVEQLQLRQIGFSDMAILNKVDLAGPAKVKKIRRRLDDAFGRLRVVETNHCDVPLEILLSVGRFDPTRSDLGIHDHGDADGCGPTCDRHGHGHRHANAFTAWSYETDRPMSLEALRETVRKLPGNIYRVKGVIYGSEASNRCAVLQAVGRRVDLSVQERWDATPRTRLVVIGAAGGVDTRRLEAAFASCAAAPKEGLVA